MLFIPTRNGDQYTPEQRERIVFNHETYLGDEEVTAIHGLQNLNTEIMLKGGKTTTIRTLLKSLPATDGMSRNRLFQIADPNAGQTCTIVTFQKVDRQFIDLRKASIEQELRSVIAQGESAKIFINEVEGIWFGGHARKRNGKPIILSIPHKADLDYIKQTEHLLNTPPKNAIMPSIRDKFSLQLKSLTGGWSRPSTHKLRNRFPSRTQRVPPQLQQHKPPKQ